MGNVKPNGILQANARLVWVDHPIQGKAHVYPSPTQITVQTRDDILDGGTVVPGFRLRLAELFAEYVGASPGNRLPESTTKTG